MNDGMKAFGINQSFEFIEQKMTALVGNTTNNCILQHISSGNVYVSNQTT